MLAVQKPISYAVTRGNLFFKRMPSYALYRGLLASSRRPIGEIRSDQLSRIQDLCRYSFLWVPYYRDLFTSHGWKSSDDLATITWEDFARLPFLTKEIIRQEKERLYSDETGRVAFFNTSGGSTGEPVLFKQDRAFSAVRGANWFLAKTMHGISPFDSEIILWGAERDIFQGGKSWSDRVKEFLRNVIVLNSFRMSVTDMDRYLDIIDTKQPKMLRSYAQSIYDLAVRAAITGRRMKSLPVIHTSASTLYPFMRERIESVFQTKVFNFYGSREAGSIASECLAHCGLHVFMESQFIEIIDQQGSSCPEGHSGEIVLTNLNNYSMPLIRYRIGDVGSMMPYAPCTCGCMYERLDTVSGRTVDRFTTTSGHVIDGEYFTHLLYFREGIVKFQVVQKAVDLLVFRLVAAQPLNDDVIKEIVHKCQMVMGSDCCIEFEYLDEIPPTPTGKHRYTISELEYR